MENDCLPATEKPRLRWYQYSLRTLLLGVTAVCVVFLLMAWWQRLPPSAWGSWHNFVFKPPGDSATTVPQFHFGGYHSNGRPIAIGYFVRIDDPRQLASPIPWLSEKSGQVFVNGRLILPGTGTLRLFVADGHQEPKCIFLDKKDTDLFLGIGSRPVGYKDIPPFWNDVLRKKYLPELTEQR
jgi:hypothetical protein